MLLGVLMPIQIYAQFVYGNTGLLHMPSAEMQRDKTVMAGWGWLDNKALPQSTGYGWAQEPTWNYYVNVTFFPWMEVSYTCTMIRGKYLAASRGYPESWFKYWANQDRHFDFRFRLWKEGWWKEWTPQIVLGLNDALHTFESDVITDSGNGFWGRLYVAATKHLDLPQVGTLGAHVAYMHNNRQDFHFNGIGAGAKLQLDGIQTGTKWLDTALHGLNVVAEYDTRTVNAGLGYDSPTILKRKSGEEILTLHAITELNDLKYPSVGVYLKVHLK